MQTTRVCVLAEQAGANVHVIDVGIDTVSLSPGLSTCVSHEVAAILLQLRTSRRQAEKLLLDVICYTRELAGAKNGVTLFGVGELGMANTTPAAAIVSTITGRDRSGRDWRNWPTDKLANKIDVVRRAITLNQPNPQDGVDVLAKVGGFDLVGMAGVMLGAASGGLPVLLDGFL
ncbi:nicotinate-nucleotide--dimethylbenzimidazole phosphoribosyltransferase [Escherichia coli]